MNPMKQSPLIAENIERLKTLFPEAAAEERIDIEVLEQLLGSAAVETKNMKDMKE